MWNGFPSFFPSIIISMANAVGSQAQNRADFFVFLYNLLKLIAFFYTAAFFGLLGHVEDSLTTSQTISSMRSLWFLRIFLWNSTILLVYFFINKTINLKCILKQLRNFCCCWLCDHHVNYQPDTITIPQKVNLSDIIILVSINATLNTFAPPLQ